MIKKIGGTIEFDLEDLIEDDVEQIVMSDTLFRAFDNSSKLKKHYDKRKSRKLFKYVVVLYNDSPDDVKFRCFNLSWKDSR